MRQHRHGIIMDADGVLWATAELHARSWLTALTDDLREFPAKEVHTITAGWPAPEGARRLLAHVASLDPQRLADLKGDRYAQLTADVAPNPGVAQALQQLRTAGYGLAVATASRSAKRLLVQTGLAPLFLHAVDVNDIPADVRTDKLRLYLEAARRLDVEPRLCCLLEDSAAAIGVASQRGFVCVGVCSTEEPDRLLAAGAAVVIDRVSDLTDAVVQQLLGT